MVVCSVPGSSLSNHDPALGQDISNELKIKIHSISESQPTLGSQGTSASVYVEERATVASIEGACPGDDIALTVSMSRTWKQEVEKRAPSNRRRPYNVLT